MPKDNSENDSKAPGSRYEESSGKNGPGQPSKVSSALAGRIARMVRQGIRLADAAERCGIDRSSLFNYLRAGRAGDTKYSSFAHIVDKAISEGKKPKQAG